MLRSVSFVRVAGLRVAEFVELRVHAVELAAVVAPEY
jgi:hypothetical protein